VKTKSQEARRHKKLLKFRRRRNQERRKWHALRQVARAHKRQIPASVCRILGGAG